ncbi:MAG: adenine deaminase [Ruminococcus sp.]|nr:adenine deaminase [Ruminococcus sp.]
MISKLIDVAMGRTMADTIIKNGTVFDVFNHKFTKTDVVISNGKIVALGDGYSAKNIIDATDKYIIPAFIDAHAHIESSLLTPVEYAKVVVPKGVTTVIADPHEITNVLGEKGISFMFKSAESVPLDVKYMLPSCVPCTPFEHSGSVIDGDLTKELLSKYAFLGLAEMMNFVGVINNDTDVIKKLSTGVFIDGHAPLLTGKELCAYVCGGIKTDHECSNVDEALEKISMGMSILVREGTGAKNIEGLVKAINPYNLNRFAFCTDDIHISDIAKDGTILNCIRKSVKLGLSLEDALTMATINPAKIYNLKDKGAIAPNYVADIIVCDKSLDNLYLVLKDGLIVAKDGEPTFTGKNIDISEVSNTVHIKEVTPQDFNLEFIEGMPVIEAVKGSLITKKAYPTTKDGLSLCAVVERHKATGNVGKAFIKNIDIQNGAIAQTIGHDSHNITVLGDNPTDMALAVNSLGSNGGICIVHNGKVISYMELEVAGLMSNKSYSEVLAMDNDIVEKAKIVSKHGSSTILMLLSFLSLVVIPELKLNDSGLFDVSNWKYI